MIDVDAWNKTSRSIDVCNHHTAATFIDTLYHTTVSLL